jgi:hydroxycarboxylate dehydrogenase B
MDSMPNISADRLKTLSREIFSRKGAPEENAETVADLLIRANLAGHDSHVVIRIPHYARRLTRED